MIPLINLHNHSNCTNPSIISIKNVYLDKIDNTDNLPKSICSVGIHPWRINKIAYNKINDKLTLLKNCIEKKQVLGIGEAGADKMIEFPIEFQMEIFEAQADIAEKAEKPLIIHAVKTYNEILKLKIDKRYNTPWIIHGFRGNSNLATQLLRHGFYLSLGKKIEFLEKTLKVINLNRLFLETDDENTEIANVYNTVSKTLNINTSSLKLQIYTNFTEAFKLH